VEAPGIIAKTGFKHKSLSAFSFNPVVGCTHGCRFCYVPSTSTNKLTPQLSTLGVIDPDADWGNYVFVREWDEIRFLRSLRTAQNTPVEELPADGNRAVMFCSTTDPYQVVRNPDPATGRELTKALQASVRRALELTRDHSDLNVRILTRSPMAKLDFDLMRSFGSRLLFGMSVPTLNDKLARIYEPSAPAPSKRLATLRAARDAGLNTFMALAPTYPELHCPGTPLPWNSIALELHCPSDIEAVVRQTRELVGESFKDLRKIRQCSELLRQLARSARATKAEGERALEAARRLKPAMQGCLSF
jgi:DNA repair photolyase